MAAKKMKRPTLTPWYVPLTPGRVLKAIKGTFGNKTRIAERCGCRYDALTTILRSPSPRWDEVREAMIEESERLLDCAETTVEEMMLQRLDLSVATKNAWNILKLKGRHRGYTETAKVIHEGGDKPIQIQQSNVNVDTLPLELRRQLLEQLETATPEKKKKEN